MKAAASWVTIDDLRVAYGPVNILDSIRLQVPRGSLYLATVIDCFSKKVVGWSIADHMRTELVEDALKNAAATTLILPNAIWHSDRGSVYTSAAFRTLVTGLGTRSSMGRTGVWDNSMAESFFSMLKNERVYRTVYATKTQARSDIIRYI
jgi:putative transposase